MKIRVQRTHFLKSCTIGKLLYDGVFSGIYTLEDEVKEIPGQPVDYWKVPEETAIPAGVYRLVINHSRRFCRDLPQILDVPGFSGVRLHAGNDRDDTEGCILLGRSVDFAGYVWDSKKALEEFMAFAKKQKSMTIEVR